MDPELLAKINALLKSIEANLASVSTRITDLFTGAPEKLDQLTTSAGKATEATEKAGETAKKTAGNFDIFSKSVEDQDSILKAYTSGASNSDSVLGKFAQRMKSGAMDVLGMSDAINKAGKENIDFRDKMEKTAQVGGLLASVVVGLGDAVGNYGQVSRETSAIGIESSTKLFESTKEGIEKLEGVFKKFTGGKGIIDQVLAPFTKVAGAMGSGVEELVKETAGVRKFESSIMGLFGQFAGFQNINRMNFTGNLENQLIRIVDQNTAVAQSTNLAIDEVNKFGQELMKLPGAFNSTVQLSGAAGGQMSMLEGAIRVARGTTGDFKDVVNDLNLQFRQFGTTNEHALDLMTKTYDLSQRLGIGFKDVDNIIGGVVKQFAMLGDNMSSSINLVGALAGALKSTGLGIEPTKAIIESITQSIGNMSLAQKAFMSQQTGGAGGLRGAFEVDMLMRQGKLDEVYKKMEQSLKGQFGGVTTLEEGSKSDTAAAELTRQVQFLTQGPFGAVVKNADQAYRLLEAFKTAGPGGIDTEAIGRETGDAMSSVLKTDEKMQEKQANALINIQNTIGQLLQEQQIGNALYIRSLAGGMNLEGSQLRELYAGERGKAMDLAGTAGKGFLATETPASAVMATVSDTIGKINQYVSGMTAAKNAPDTEAMENIVPEIPAGPVLPSAPKEVGIGPTLPGMAPRASGTTGINFTIDPLTVIVKNTEGKVIDTQQLSMELAQIEASRASSGVR